MCMFFNAPVAQLDRVLGYEPRGREFESLRARHFSFTARFSGVNMTNEYLKNNIESYVEWFNQRSQKTVLTYAHEFDASQSQLKCLIVNKQYDYEEIQFTAYGTNKTKEWSVDSSFIKGDPSNAMSESVYKLDNIDSLTRFSNCIRNLLMDILVDEETGLRT
jgi:hypothetical protein